MRDLELFRRFWLRTCEFRLSMFGLRFLAVSAHFIIFLYDGTMFFSDNHSRQVGNAAMTSCTNVILVKMKTVTTSVEL